ncbi:MAG: protein-disulfide reductase DsbD, partial [Aeromonas sp.]|nr:protein-disulfide reductase DsbD [Aeromonas sp.]
MTASRPLSFLLMLLGLLCVLTTAPARASSQDLLGSLGIETQPRFLKVDQAFALESEQQGDRLLLRIRIADGYYLYRHSIRVKGENLAFDEPVLPPGTEHEDDFFGKSRVYYQEVQIPVALTRVGDAASLTLSYQGCTEGLCYPPTDKRIAVEPLAAPARAEAP